MFTWSDIWAGWLIAVFASFGILEGWSLSVTPRDTLSETTWSWLHVVAGQGIEHWTLPHLIAVIVLILIALILVLHLGLGWFNG